MEFSLLTNVSYETGLPEANGSAFHTMVPFKRYPDKRTPKEVVAELKLQKGQTIFLPGRISHVVSKITADGKVFVHGLRRDINVYGISL